MSGRWRLVAGLLGLALVGSYVPAGSQARRPSEDRFFSMEWQVERDGGRDAAVVGSLDNHYLYSLQRVQVQAQVVDGAGQVTHETLATIDEIPPGGRGTFRLQLPASGARYVITVYSFEFGSRESP